jgi:antitoxin component of MazEF toxin-antitoxin module
LVAKTERKIIQLAGSLVVVMPHDWIQGMELKAGDPVEVLYDDVVTVRKKALKE